MVKRNTGKVNAHELLWKARCYLMKQGSAPDQVDWRLVDNLDMAVPALTNAVNKPQPWRSVPQGAKLRLLRRLALKLIRPSSDRQDAINEGQTVTLVLLLESARVMAERIDVLERCLADCQDAIEKAGLR